MQIKEMLANSSNDTKGRKQNIQYIVVHYTANNENRAESNGILSTAKQKSSTMARF